MRTNNPFTIEVEQPNTQTSGEILDAINEITDGSEKLEDLEDAFNRLDLKEKQLKLQIQTQEHSNNDELHEIRKTHLQRLFILTCVWSGLVIFVLISTGLKRLWWFPTPPCLEALKFELESSVLIAFITSTTATIIGLYTIAAYWLFKKKD
ncbi:hypothetical protein ACLSY0_00335 [Avibacterium avium]|uniref:hypothetical protein n=1 Tax=Avibacterium avium TaxID=751 RepID=UPI003BF7A621